MSVYNITNRLKSIDESIDNFGKVFYYPNKRLSEMPSLMNKIKDLLEPLDKIDQSEFSKEQKQEIKKLKVKFNRDVEAIAKSQSTRCSSIEGDINRLFEHIIKP